MEGPNARRKQIHQDDTRRELERVYPKVPPAKVKEVLDKHWAGKLDMGAVMKVLADEQNVHASKEFSETKEDPKTKSGKKIVLYVTNQTGDRHVRYKCNRLRLSFTCLRLDWEEVDIAGNRWLRQKLVQDAKVDEIPLVFVGLGVDGKFAGTYDELIAVIDEGKIYEHFRSLGYAHMG
eukprot:TRINITY_DN3516_c0_g1_i3.p1 TRINITY_DN3516_c0_g1~~TRINITY_DN3516_c0_g1_i3.p1  ORF type:complete len:178 (+),score=22.47 TRINITY_DN3516_c0_g1_i3:120-653(+)